MEWMANMTPWKIAEACGGTYIGKEEEKERKISSVVLDSRQVEEGSCFLAVRGERVDGHKFIPEVLKTGAACVVCEYAPEEMTGNFIVVKDTLKALQRIAEYYRSTLQIPIIGITGSVGKTSTKEFIAGVLSRKYKVLKTEGNFNNEIGVPLTLLKIRPEHELAVLEMGINHFGEMHRLSRMVKPDACVMTNIGTCHLEFLGSREGILRAKSEIFDYLKDDGQVFVNGDDDMLQTIGSVKGKKTVTFGMGQQNDIYADEITVKGLLGSEAVLHLKGEALPVAIHLPGEHTIRNALAAAAVGEAFGLTHAEIAAGIGAVMPVGGRSNIIRCGKMTLIDDCYNANPVSMRAALDLLCQAEGRTIAILGDMGELGEKELTYHAEIGAYAVKKGISELFCVGKLSASMYQGACAEKEKQPEAENLLRYYETVDEMLLALREMDMSAGDAAVLIKASHSMHFERIVEALRASD